LTGSAAHEPSPHVIVRFDDVENLCHPGQDNGAAWFGVMLQGADLQDNRPGVICTTDEQCLDVGSRVFFMTGGAPADYLCEGLGAEGCAGARELHGAWNEVRAVVRTAYNDADRMTWEDATLDFDDFIQGVRNVVANVDWNSGCAVTGCEPPNTCFWGAACTEIHYNGTNPDLLDAGRPMPVDSGTRPSGDDGGPPPLDGGR
jgi:hypothetical protein